MPRRAAPGAVDCHAHWIPPDLAALLRRRRVAPSIGSAPGGGERLVTFQEELPFGTAMGDLDTRLAAMKGWGLDRQVLSLGGLFGVDSLPADEAQPLVAAFNGAAAAAMAAAPGRFAALAALPLADPTRAAAELTRAHAMGLRGAVLPADAFLTPEAAARLTPVLAAADRLGSHLFVHPGPVVPPPEGRVPDAAGHAAWQRRIVLETQARLSSAVVTLGLSDLLDAYPRVTVQVANLGGAIPFLAERMDEVARQERPGAPLPSERLRHGRVHVDSASFGPRAVAQAVACFGSERVLLGTDCPIFDPGRMLAAAAAAGLDATETALLLGGNARRLFG
jgi:predicted TIM-barrel fold metal-dependent hydrolase